MTEDNQDMEDILSSIKNILEEDERQQSMEISVKDDVLDNLLNTSSDDEDILDLSPEMMVSDEDFSSTKDAVEELIQNEDTPLVTGVDDVSSTVFDTTDYSLELDSDDSVLENDSFFSVDETPSLLQEDNVPIESSVEDMVAYNDDSLAVENNVNKENTEEVAMFDYITEDKETSVEPVELIEEAGNDISQEYTYHVEDDFDINKDGIADNVNTKKEDEVVKDTTDVSANIISNFAKMFSREDKTPKNVEMKEDVVISTVGNTSKTLEEFVLDSVIKVVGKEISSQWNDGADFKVFAETEIVRQTKEWINDNLPSLVEKVVKQEIERVIAKVGS